MRVLKPRRTVITPGVALNTITRRGGWHYPAKHINTLNLGADLITNGDFSLGTGWTLGTGWSISGGTLIAASGVQSIAGQAVVITAGKRYLCVVDVPSITSGFATLILGGQQHARAITAIGTFRALLLAGTTGLNFEFQKDSAANAKFDNVTLREVLT